MDELARRIRGAWFEIRESMDDPYAIEERFALSASELRAVAEALRGSIEGGVSGYKISILNSFFSFLESLKYDSKGFESLIGRAATIRRLTYISLYQRLFALGIMGPKKSKSEQGPEKDPAAQRAGVMDVKEILGDVRKRMETDPSLRSDQAVKSILMQIQIYRRELERMNSLSPNIPPEKKESFAANFRGSFEEITQKIRHGYASLIRPEVESEIAGKEERSPLERYDLSGAADIFTSQAQETSMLEATVEFAIKDRYKTREVLTGLVPRRERLSELIRREEALYRDAEGPAPGPDSISRAFIAELARLFTRQAERAL